MTLESVQKNSSTLLYSSSSLSMLLTVTEMVAAVSSNLGIVVTFVGDTRAFPMTKTQGKSLSLFIILR